MTSVEDAVPPTEILDTEKADIVDERNGRRDGAHHTEPNGVDDDADDDPYEHLSPPRSCGERFRDGILRVLDHPIFQVMGLIVLFLVIADGALFFFFLMGWQSLCRPRTDCDPRNQIYNISVQILNGLFTYMVTVSMPWRCTNAMHIFGWGCPYRDNTPGLDLYGLVSHDVWYHVSLYHRKWIVIFLLLNCLTQYANQATRIVYWNYDVQNVSPGNIWTNVFFVSSMLFAAIGGIYLGIVTEKIRKADFERFGPGPVQMIQKYWVETFPSWACECCMGYKDAEVIKDEANDSDIRSSMQDQVGEMPPIEHGHDPTRDKLDRTVVRGGSRSNLRMFAM